MANFFDWLDTKKILFSRTPGGQTLISEDVDLAGSDIQRLPDELLVGGHLILRNTLLATLPLGLNVLEDLDLRNTSITALPPDLSVGGGLFLENTRIVSLPDNFRIEDALDLENSLVAALPRNLWVGGYLNLRGTAISSLPKDWYVEGPLLLDVEKIASPLAWRYINPADLKADDHLMGDYCLDTSSVGDFFDKADDEEFIEIFAVWVSGEIRVYAGRHYGIPQKFMGDDTSDTFQQIIRDCVAELEERLSIFSSLAQFERRLLQERTRAGLAAARARGRKGGRRAVSKSAPKVMMAWRMYQDKSLSINEICETLKISRATFFRYVSLAKDAA